MKFYIPIVLALSLICFGSSYNEPDIESIKNTKIFFDKITKNGGVWVADNVNYDKNNPTSFSQFILEFIRIDSLSLRASIKGINQNQDTIHFWEVWEFLDVATGKTKLIQRSPAGHYGFGEADYDNAEKRSGQLDFNFTNGAKSKHKSIHEFLDEDLMVSISEDYDEKSGKWVKSQPQEWRRVIESTDFENPYKKLEYLIGTWEVDFGKGIAFMTYEWGPNKSYITCTNENIIDGKQSQENFSLIIWDGVREVFVVNTSYTKAESLLYGHGTMNIHDNLISRDLTVHYAEGQYMPFLKRKADKKGFVMPYRQRWKIIDKNTFEGEFEVFVDGKYSNPFNKPKELWTRK